MPLPNYEHFYGYKEKDLDTAISLLQKVVEGMRYMFDNLHHPTPDEYDLTRLEEVLKILKDKGYKMVLKILKDKGYEIEKPWDIDL